MATDILIKRSTTPGAVPTTGDLSTGELAINTADKRLFTNNSGTIVEIGTAPTSLAVTNNGTIGGTLDVTGNTTVATGTATNWTVTGTLTVPTPSNSTDAASKGYVDTADALKVNKSGDTMSGALAMGTNKITGLGTPTVSTDAATKGYVDAQVTAVIDSAPGALDTLNELAAAINDDANFATTITTSIATKLPLAGGTMTGDIAMGANKVTSTATPATDDTLTRKGYVDTQDATKLNLSGGTMTGNITMGANAVTSTATPATADTLTRKGYVDSILGSATDAATSATAAASSATDAANSATAAATSATNAATSASNASTSETNAATSASAASSSATASANSATSAASSATAAATSAAQAAASYDSFDDRYLGSKTSDPTLDNDGNALVTGALYFNSTDGEMRIYDGSVWIAASSASVETMEKFNFTATSGQTVFTGTDDNAKTLALTVGAEMVTLNGVVLEETTDYTRTSDTITLTSGATTGDEVNVFAFGNFTVADTVSASTGGTFTGAVTFDGGINGNTNVTGTVTADGLTLSSASSPNLNITDTTNTVTTQIASTDTQGFIGTLTNHTFQIVSNGTKRLRIESNGDINLGYEDTGTTPKLFWDASAESLGIGTTSPSGTLQLRETTPSLYITSDDSGTGYLYFGGASSPARAAIYHNDTDDSLAFRTASAERMRIDSSGNVGIGTSSPTTVIDARQTTTGGATQIRLFNTDNSATTTQTASLALSPDSRATGALVSGVKENADFSTTAGRDVALTFSPVLNNSPTERMRIHSSGDIAFNTTGFPGDLYDASDNGAAIGSDGRTTIACNNTTPLVVNRSTNDGVTRNLITFYRAGVGLASITGNTSTVNYNTGSDYRLKENIVEMTGAVERVKQLNPTRFNFILTPETTVDGFLAHEVQDVVPEAVVGEKDAVDAEGNPEYQGIDQSKLVPLLTAALQEAIGRIETLEAEVATLKGN